MTPRQQALAQGETRYHGRPCKHCGTTRRLVSSRHCMRCKAAKEDRRYWSLTGVQFNRLLLDRRRTKALARMAARNRRKKEQGGPLQGKKP